MLVLGRRQGECIRVDGPAVIYVNRIDRGSVRLAVEADDDVVIQRGEEPDKSSPRELREEMAK